MYIAAAEKINMDVVFTMSTKMNRAVISSLLPGQETIYLPDGSQMQIYTSLAHVGLSPPGAIKRFQYAAVVREEGLILIWHHHLDKILVHAAAVEAKLVALVQSSSLFSKRWNTNRRLSVVR